VSGYMDPPVVLMVDVFRIHDFNVQQVLALFLPYHESPHFAKMITILQIKCGAQSLNDNKLKL
jgi:hypothetical protein